jgi:hypothetical protein
MRGDRAARTDMHRAAPNTIAEKRRIGSGFDHSSPVCECEPARHTCIDVRKFAPFRPRYDGAARRLSRTVLPDRKAITFHLRRI